MTQIAERAYHDPAGRVITVRIGQPEPDPAGDWRCSVHVDGIEQEPRDVHGIDALQALEIAIDYARLTIERSGIAVSWLGGAGAGISMTVPSYLPAAMQRELERVIDEQVSDFAVTRSG